MSGICLTHKFENSMTDAEVELLNEIRELQSQPLFTNKFGIGYANHQAKIDEKYSELAALKTAQAAGVPTEVPHDFYAEKIAEKQASESFKDKFHPDHRKTVDHIDSLYRLQANAPDAPVGLNAATRLVPSNNWTEAQNESARLRQEADAQRFSSSGQPLKFVS